MQRYAAAPEDARGIIQPSAGVTELREAEEALLQLQTELTHALKQKQRLAQLGEAVAKISHDLRNILTSAQLFTDRIEMSEDPLVRRLAPKLVNSMTRAISLCEGTLAFGRAEEPAPTLTMMTLSEVIEDLIEAERIAVGDDRVEFVSDVPAELVLRADPEQIYRIVMNLVRNARQAIAAAGRDGVVTISAFEDPEAWWVSVSDTGPGLPKRAQDNLFTAFQGGTRKGGTGLGLAIAAELAQGHGGSVSLRKTGAEGTIFDVCLPKGDGTL